MKKIPEQLLNRINSSLAASREALDFIEQGGKVLLKNNVEDLPKVEGELQQAIETLQQAKREIVEIRHEQAATIGKLLEAAEPAMDAEHDLAHVLTFINNLPEYMKVLTFTDPESIKMSLDRATPENLQKAANDLSDERKQEIVAILSS